MSDAIYNTIGGNYSVTRCTDPVIFKQLNAKLAGASNILNIGAGTGSYEPSDAELIALEPSAKMIAQRPAYSHPATLGFAESLPFADNSFSHVLTVLSMHHWSDHQRAFAEINRVGCEHFVAITWDPNTEPFWLTRDYFPEIYQADVAIFPTMELLAEHFDELEVTPLNIPHNCIDGFFAAFWRRPEAYLQPQVRQGMSPFASFPDIANRLERLRLDLTSGAWAKRNSELLAQNHFDAGYRLICGKIRN